MVSRWSPHRWPLAAALVLALAATPTGAVAAPDPAGGQPADAGAPAADPSPTRDVLTLITGDRVVLDRFDGGRRAVTIRPADRGDREPGFHTVEDGGQVYVTPSDAAALVPEVLDREPVAAGRGVGPGRQPPRAGDHPRLAARPPVSPRR